MRHKSTVIILLLLVGIFISISLCGNGLKDNIRYYPNWMSAIFLFIIFSQKSNINRFCNAFKKNQFFIYSLLLIFAFVLLLALLNPNCYSDEVWGGYPYFKAYTTQHAVAASCCMGIALCILYYQICHKSFILVIVAFISTIGLLRTGSRSFLFGFLILSFFGCKALIKNKKMRACVYIILAVAMCYAVIGSSIGEKFIYSINRKGSGSLLHKLTSGRSTFWLIDIKAFGANGMRGILFGHGFDYSYNVNEKYYGMSIWAHNDFLETLLSTGLIGFSLYVTSLLKFLKNNIKNAGNAFSIFMYILIPSFINGNLNTQIYCMSAIILIAILFCQAENKDNCAEHTKIHERGAGLFYPAND